MSHARLHALELNGPSRPAAPAEHGFIPPVRDQPGVAGGHDQPPRRSVKPEIGDVDWCRYDEGVELTADGKLAEGVQSPGPIRPGRFRRRRQARQTL